jgi:hypothetical protein
MSRRTGGRLSRTKRRGSRSAKKTGCVDREPQEKQNPARNGYKRWKADDPGQGIQHENGADDDRTLIAR